MDLNTLIKTTNYSYINNDQIHDKCTICLGNTSGKVCRVLKCGHIFHCECIDEWFLKKTTCPVCRLDLKKSIQENIQNSSQNVLTNDQNVISIFNSSISYFIFFSYIIYKNKNIKSFFSGFIIGNFTGLSVGIISTSVSFLYALNRFNLPMN